MELDKTTFSDLSIFSQDEDFSVFGRLNETVTVRGKEELQRMLTTPLKTAADIKNVQEILKLVLRKESGWTKLISNGTIMVLERFFDSNIDQMPSNPSAAASFRANNRNRAVRSSQSHSPRTYAAAAARLPPSAV